jgi:hypothetical protein
MGQKKARQKADRYEFRSHISIAVRLFDRNSGQERRIAIYLIKANG